MAQSTPTNLYCSRASFGCAYMHHIEKYVFQQETVAPGLGLLLWWSSGRVLREKFLQGDVSITHMRSCYAQYRYQRSVVTMDHQHTMVRLSQYAKRARR